MLKSDTLCACYYPKGSIVWTRDPGGTLMCSICGKRMAEEKVKEAKNEEHRI